MRHACCILLIALAILSCKPLSKKNDNCCCSVEFYINSIDSINDYYIIYARERIKGHNYKIVSKKEQCESNNKIKVGGTYYLETTSIFTAMIDGKEEYIGDNLFCITISDSRFCKEPENYIFDVSKSKNLRGLCYIKD